MEYPRICFLPGPIRHLLSHRYLKAVPFSLSPGMDEYVFVKDIMWRSALGMPTGIMGGNTAYAFADASDDYIKILPANSETKNGIYLSSLLQNYGKLCIFDKVQLVAVDHPDSVDVFVPEQFYTAAFPGLSSYSRLKRNISPFRAIDAREMMYFPLLLKRMTNICLTSTLENTRELQRCMT